MVFLSRIFATACPRLVGRSSIKDCFMHRVKLTRRSRGQRARLTLRPERCLLAPAVLRRSSLHAWLRLSPSVRSTHAAYAVLHVPPFGGGSGASYPSETSSVRRRAAGCRHVQARSSSASRARG